MNLEEIARAALGLYREESPEITRAILSDALRERGETWEGWLESSGTLERLAEEMCLASRPGAMHEFSDDQISLNIEWCVAVLGDSRFDPSRYVPLCAAFGVPPVMCEIGERRHVGYEGGDWGNPGRHLTEIRWSAPSPALALAVLRDGIGGHLHNVAMVSSYVRQHHPQATAYRLKIADGEWQERRIG